MAATPDSSASAGHATGDHAAPARPAARLWALLHQERQAVVLVYSYAALAGLFSLALPLGVQAAIGLVSGGLFLQPVVLLIAFVVAGTGVAGGLQLMQLRVVETVQQRVFARLALGIAERLPQVGLERSRGRDLPELMNRFFEVVTIQKSLAKLLTETSAAALQLVFGLTLLTLYHPYFLAFGLGLCVLLFVGVRLTAPAGVSTSLAESAAKYRTAHWLEEVARTVVAHKFAGRSTLVVDRADDEVADYLVARERHFRVLQRQAAALVAFRTLLTAALLVLGSALVIDRQITLGQFVAAELVVVLALAGVDKLVLSLDSVYDLLTALEKSAHALGLPLDAPGAAGGPEAVRVGLTVETNGLSYRYPGSDRPVLSDVSIVARPGEWVAVTGVDGAGQTTLLRTLAGLHAEYGGAVTYDGVSGRDHDARALRAEVGLCEGSADLFEGTLAENVSLGRPGLGSAAVREALARVGLGPWAAQLPAGLSTRLEPGGQGLPSLTAHQLVLARAIVGRPRLLLFDEYFHHLEPTYKRHAIRLLRDGGEGWTVVAVSHDPVFLRQCDRVYLLQDGRVAAAGRYDELVRDHPRAAPALAEVPAADRGDRPLHPAR